ncbi:2-methylene-furan-3-one reductase-like [Cryptomeria japonica]|uniref:2-methylene-furan-3-one reductase-like n=1 Tax=Cryptomeria japonica TaxID=3369 RepID=UPI0027DA0FEA|nr:2-methylene-furan-3-one reductase-like [Cryptomeria japonica]
MMKAWLYKEYGSVDVLQFGEIPIPSAGSGQVLIKVRAAALNPVDFKLRRSRSGDTPFPVVPGADVAGVVAEVGQGVSKFKKGDVVYGNILKITEGKPRQVGTLAEYTVAEEHVLALQPSNLSFEEAASLPLALQTALQAFDTVGFQKGQSVFIVGGAGGVGSLAIQLAKHVFEASRIVSTCSTGKVEFVRSLGTDLVVDYTKQSYDQVDEKFDFVFDTIGESFKSHVVAKEGGKIVDIASFPPHSSAVSMIVKPQGSNLERLGKYIRSGKLKPVIDPKSPYAFSDVVEAFKHLESGRARGKIVISPIE